MDPTRTEIHLAAIQRCRLFAGLSAEECRHVLRLAREREVARKDVLFEQGDEAARLHLLVSGEVAIRQAGADGQEVIARMIGPGEAFAEAAMIAGTAYPATAEAVVASRVLVWDAPAVDAMLDRFPRIARNIATDLLARVRELEERFREVATQRVGQRVARALARLARQTGRRTPNGAVAIDIPLTRETIAQLTGTTLFTVSRLLTEWEERGIVEVGRERVVICDRHALVKIAEDLP